MQLADRLIKHIADLQSVAVAFSGGVDSAVVARAAVEALGEQAVAVTAVSPSLAASELKIAREEAASIGIRHVEISTDEFSNDDYVANRGDRCFFCKDTLYRLTKDQLKELGVVAIVNGTNVDDLGDHRPGLQAAADHSVRSPLADLEITKSQVRELARFWHLSVAEKPASPCLSSRVAYGVEVTADRVRRVEQAEALLRNLLPESELRVRLEAGELARIEVPPAQFTAVATHAAKIAHELKTLGFSRITLDLEGFRSGSLNDALVQLGNS